MVTEMGDYQKKNELHCRTLCEIKNNIYRTCSACKHCSRGFQMCYLIYSHKNLLRYKYYGIYFINREIEVQEI